MINTTESGESSSSFPPVKPLVLFYPSKCRNR